MLRQSLRSVFTLTLICFMIGGLFALYLRYAPSSQSQTNALSQRMDNLVSTINNLEQEIAAYEGIVQTSRDELAGLENQAQTEWLRKLQEELHGAKLRAGLTPVTGSGIVITLDDNVVGQKADPNGDPNAYIIHYEDLLAIVSELKTGGAEAIAINEQRLITTSELRCVGNVILVNTTRIAPPFVIHAIGDPSILADMVTYGRLDPLITEGFPVSVSEDQALILPAYKGELQFKYTTFS